MEQILPFGRFWTSASSEAQNLYEQAQYYADFTQNIARNSGVWSSAVSTLVTARTSVAQMDSSAGVWGQFAAASPRISDKGLLAEETRVNSIRNSTMAGAVAGTPGTLPNLWARDAAGLSQSIATGTENGIDYIDLRLFGTTAATTLNINFEGNIAAVNAQAWAGSCFVALVAGSFTNITDLALRASAVTAASAYLGETWNPTFYTTLPSSLSPASRIKEQGTITFATTGFILPYLQLRFASGVAVDITLRIGWPQYELGAYFTSPIKTSSVVVTRSPDIIHALQAINTTGSTFFLEWISPQPAVSGSVIAGGLGDGATFAKSLYVSRTATNVVGVGPNAAEPTIAINSAILYVGESVAKTALAVALNNSAFSYSGDIGADNSSAVPTLMDRFRFGNAPYSSTTQLNGYVRRAAYWPSRLTNAQLQAITA